MQHFLIGSVHDLQEKSGFPEVEQVSALIHDALLPPEQEKSKVQLKIHTVTLRNKEHIDLNYAAWTLELSSAKPAHPVQYSSSYSLIYQCLIKNGKQLPTRGGKGQVELWRGARGRKERRGHSSNTPASAVLCWQITNRLASLPFPGCAHSSAPLPRAAQKLLFFCHWEKGTSVKHAGLGCAPVSQHTLLAHSYTSSSLNPSPAYACTSRGFCSSLRLWGSFQTLAQWELNAFFSRYLVKI